ncbi:hypothetical protein GQX73_g4993 [Xylaria multiplex]|uniref:Uncharacterized protein n=1 Tax=Xylaria multiplex TaxID=323545 RepID=A0A7C8IP23_9PEZI|nr:hypothetical protein GQX73_g4993 [Xylaria multiplex]
MPFAKPTGLAASRWASGVTSWPRPPPPHSHPTVASVGVGQPGSSLPSRRLADTPSSTPSHNDQPSSPEQQLSRFLKIVARLKWKIPFLETGYAIAVDRVGKLQQEVDANEIHFKLDFHEFYMLIERALVHLMGVYDIVIYAQSDPNGNGFGVRNAARDDPDAFRDRSQPHRYHENVLLALDTPSNPLHETLGQPIVRKQLARAKELRNRWKNADDANPGRFMPAPLEAYNLKEILQTILLALEQAYFVTEEYIRRRNPGADLNHPVSTADWTTDSDDWEFMVDASK